MTLMMQATYVLDAIMRWSHIHLDVNSLQPVLCSTSTLLVGKASSL